MSFGKIRFIALAVWILFSIGLQIFETFPKWHNMANDFNSYYVGSKLLWMHKNPYLINNDFVAVVKDSHLNFLFGTGYSYPPLLAFLMYPFTFLTENAAVRIWQLFSCFLYAIFIYKVLRANQQLSLKRYLFLAVVLISFIPVIGSIAMGQVNIVILILFSAYFLSKSESVRASGLVLASLIKVYPLLFIIKDFAYKQFRFISKFVGILFSVLLLLGIVSEFDLLIYYFTVFLPKLNNTFDPYYTNQSVTGVLSRLLEVSPGTFLISQIDFSHVISFITAVCLGGLMFLSLKFSNKKLLIDLLWIGVISLIAGKNSFWNFAPCILLAIYFIQNFDNLSKTQKVLFLFSVFLSNFFWFAATMVNNSSLVTAIASSKVLYNCLNAVGFVYLSIQVGLLLFLLQKKKNFLS